jgi:DNA gyrase subunit A
MSLLLIDGQGNLGSVDNDPPAAMRYTESRMTRAAMSILADLDKDTVDFKDNYDGSEQEPAVLPSRIPNLLVNGAGGIAVGMATNIPPHNLGEIVDACIALIDDPELGLADLMRLVPGPDFPTAGIINGAAEIVAAYKSGRGRLSVRARTAVESIDDRGREAIVVTELPYQVNKARLLERIADLVRAKEIEGISELRDESDKDGLRVVIELKRGENSELVLNQLFKLTPMEAVFGVNMVALLDGQPKLLSLKEILDAFLRHRREVVTRRTIHDLRKARERAHLLEGLAVALANIDEVITLIKASPSPPEARAALQARAWGPGAGPAMRARWPSPSLDEPKISSDTGPGVTSHPNAASLQVRSASSREPRYTTTRCSDASTAKRDTSRPDNGTIAGSARSPTSRVAPGSGESASGSNPARSTCSSPGCGRTFSIANRPSAPLWTVTGSQ